MLYLNSSVLSDFAFAAKRQKIKNLVHIREPIAQGIFGLRKKLISLIFNYACDDIIAISHDNAKG
ncbi:MAG: hypothetical protein IPH11_00785 [Ignavibacteriales bacterium]|nr:hypothetical protein [Ignavibacteriales bacterium]